MPEEDRDCPYCNTPMEVIGKKVVREELRIIPAKVERIQYVQEVLGCPECKKDGASVIVGAETPSPLLKHSLWKCCCGCENEIFVESRRLKPGRFSAVFVRNHLTNKRSDRFAIW